MNKKHEGGGMQYDTIHSPHNKFSNKKTIKKNQTKKKPHNNYSNNKKQKFNTPKAMKV